MKIRSFTFLVFLFFALPAEARWLDKILTHDGLVRKYRLFLPLARQDLSLVIALHGGGGGTTTLELMGSLSRKAELYRAIVVFPQGVGKIDASGKEFGTWNAGRCCGKARGDDVDDVGFLKALIHSVSSEYPVNKSKVYMLGHSNGAMMSYRYACEASETIAAIGVVGSPGVFDSAVGKLDNCPLSNPMPTLHIHGTADHCSPYNGGEGGACMTEFFSLLLNRPIPPDPLSTVEKPDTKTFLNNWMSKSGYVKFELGERHPPAVVCDTFGTRSPRVVKGKLCTVTGMGHTWPGGDYGEPCTSHPFGRGCELWKQVCAGPADTSLVPYPFYSATDAIFSFFAQHRLR